MDEGFGTQDMRGREHLVSAINSIQDDFDLILVITHIDELKEAFPTRIEVSKRRDGSTFQLT
jgi:exonuclease SbcC